MKLIKPGNIKNIMLILNENKGARSIPIQSIANPIIAGIAHCKWCAQKPVYGQRQYCSEDCKFSMYVFAYPQTFPATRVLMERQKFKCAVCSFDYTPYIHDAIENLTQRLDVAFDWDEHSYSVLDTVNKIVPEERKPEVDHIIQVSEGGETFGLTNVEIKCATCHQSKTSAEARIRNKEQNTYSGTRATYKKVRDMN